MEESNTKIEAYSPTLTIRIDGPTREHPTDEDGLSPTVDINHEIIKDQSKEKVGESASEAEANKTNGAVPALSTDFKKGDTAMYKDREIVTIAGVHLDDPTEIYFTIKKSDGVEVNTVAKYLKPTKPTPKTGGAEITSDHSKGPPKAGMRDETEGFEDESSRNVDANTQGDASGATSLSEAANSQKLPVINPNRGRSITIRIKKKEDSDEKIDIASGTKNNYDTDLSFNHTTPMAKMGGLHKLLMEGGHTGIALKKTKFQETPVAEHKKHSLNTGTQATAFKFDDDRCVCVG
uniref:Uncharacterized protein n=1 Tax=Lotharella globosa TaxID=91324 RepID=A0A7S4DWT5_9EUKA|mmetsp:Transcript_10500/g.20844  ORF Transcript_10500/g.20844 Transcript_10500/m.20844 type:complete len:292 (+) Transcript_10500:161-1036(+)